MSLTQVATTMGHSVFCTTSWLGPLVSVPAVRLLRGGQLVTVAFAGKCTRASARQSC